MDTPTSNPPEAPKEVTTTPSSNRTLMAILAYVGPLIIVSYLVAKYDSFVKFHIRQAAVLFAIEIIVWIFGMVITWQISMILNLVNIFTLVLSIIGIVNVLQNKEKELPLVGKFSRHFTFLS